MKKRILLFSIFLVIVLVAAFAFNDMTKPTADQQELASTEVSVSEAQPSEKVPEKKDPVIQFDLGPRFKGIKKSELNKATSFADFIGQKHANRIIKYKSLSVIELDDDKQTDRKITTNSGELTQAQREHLQAAGLSTNVLIWAEYTEKWEESGLVEDSYWTPHLTVVPEKQAVYVVGEKAFIDYLEENIPEFRNFLRKEQLQPGRIYFTVGKEGTITQVELQATSGIPEMDEKLVKLVHEAPGKWTPAENVKGEKVAQVLVVFFGSLGC
ncbi:MAG: hypothetical protein OEQ81_09070 [Flavobacteriaceae bacterium]|nr:hypothetical protein [Flavobacteriaceae bacterium]